MAWAATSLSLEQFSPLPDKPEVSSTGINNIRARACTRSRLSYTTLLWKKSDAELVVLPFSALNITPRKKKIILFKKQLVRMRLITIYCWSFSILSPNFSGAMETYRRSCKQRQENRRGTTGVRLVKSCCGLFSINFFKNCHPLTARAVGSQPEPRNPGCGL